MDTHRLGRTGLEISEVVFGGGYVGGVLVLADEETRRAVLRRALAAGINWVDTAPSYGDGKSESHLGQLLGEMSKKRPFVSTKVRLDPSRLDDIMGEVQRSVEASLERLGLEQVELLQLHNQIYTDESAVIGDGVTLAQVLDDDGIADALERMRLQGLTRHVGLTALGDAPAVVAAIDSDRFDTAQVYYNMLNPSAAREMPPAWRGHDFSGVLAACERHDVGVMAIRVFAGGVLVSDQRTGREAVITRDSELARESARARAVFDALGEQYSNHVRTALGFGLANPQLDAIVVGMAEPAHLEAIVSAVEAGPLPEEALAVLESQYRSNFGGIE